MRRITLILLALIMCVSLVCCQNNVVFTSKDGGQGAGADTSTKKDDSPGAKGEIVMIEMKIKDHGTVKLELYPDIAPITVANFVKLASEGFYDGLTFHRIYHGFMIQGGDPDGNGTGGSGENIKGEFAVNGVNNTLSHTRGVISMARSQKYDSASSQFFIMHQDSDFLDGQYAAFGKVVEGMEVIDSVASVECTYSYSDRANTTPVEPPVMEYVRVIGE